ncbi:hypothetical protein GXB85_06130 [Cellulomonas sp. APG4]|uniref:hypothetical protein n=1 Tax=Cellulomonas sp. APG4 TaxID=1538656 RepID=UPI00137968C1|nr:hypothetical protein [Cellulomonas sp. APG4]NCT90522.1 hypothetical protein [Cellulomonas sp. APG4]
MSTEHPNPTTPSTPPSTLAPATAPQGVTPQRASRGWWIAGIATAVVLTSLGSNAFARTELGQDVTQKVETATDRVDHGVEGFVDGIDRALP